MIPVDFNVSAANEGTQDQPVYTIAAGTTLAENKTETNSPTPVVVKTGNFKMQFDLIAQNINATPNMTVYIMYCPEGVNPAGGLALRDFMLKHPEWVIAWRKIDLDFFSGSPGNSQTNRITMSSRLKRNLNSGDKVNVYLFSTSGVVATSGVKLSGMCQFWSCAN